MQTENKNQNKAYLKHYEDILKNVMCNKLEGQSILYIVKGILISGKPREDCWGFASLDAYLKKQQKIEKIEYLRDHMDVLNMNLMDMVDGQSILYTIKEILVSSQTLKNCKGYQLSNQYIEESEKCQGQVHISQNQSPKLMNTQNHKEELELLHMLSSVVSAANKSQDMSQVSRITSFYQYVGKESDMKGYQKQMVSIA